MSPTLERQSADPQKLSKTWYVGFSCKTVCGYNTQYQGIAVDDSGCTTGLTLWGVEIILQDQQPDSMILENVFGLLTDDQHEMVISKIEAKGYISDMHTIYSKNKSTARAI